MRTLTWIGLPVLLTSAAGAQEPLRIPCDSLDDVTIATGSASLEVREDDGRIAIAMIDQSLGSATLAFDPAVPVEPGRAYVMAIDMRAAGLRSCQVQPTVTFIDADGEGLDYMAGDWVVGMAPWRRVRVVAVAPEDATHAILGVHGMTASMTPLPEDHRTGTALVDDIRWMAAPRIEVTSSAPGNVVEEGQPIELAFSATHVPEGADWSWRAETVDWRGDATFQADTPGLRDGLTWQSEYDGLGRGYYELRWSVDRDGEMVYEGREAFAVVPPLAEQPYDPGSQIALDAGFSWFVAEDPERLALAAHLARMAGLTCLRDRLSWARTNPAEGTLEWDPYDDAAAAQHAEGLTVYQVFHDCPSWAAEVGEDPITPHTAPPRDLRDVYRYFREAASGFEEEIPFWEIWNEPDIFFFGGRPEEYAGILKAAYLGCHHGNPEARVLLGSLAHPPEEWYRRAFECGLTDYFDIWNMHYYGAPEGVVERIEGNRKLMLSHGPEKPIWITEMGVPAYRADDGTFTASERDQAAYLVKAYGHSLGHGVDRFFYFFMHEFLEAAANLWGITRADLTPKPAYMALAQLAHLVGDRHCVGRLDVGDEGLYAYAWGPEDDAIVAVWTSGGEASLPGIEHDAVLDIMGRSVPRGPVTPTPVYLVGASIADIPLRFDAGPVLGAEDPADLGALGIVLDLRLLPEDDAPIGDSARKQAPEVGPDEPLPLRVGIYNFSDSAASVRPVLELPAGWSAEGGLPESVGVAPGEVAEFELRIRPARMAPAESYAIALRASSEGHRIAPVVAYVDADPDGFEPAMTHSLGPAATDPHTWEATSGDNVDFTVELSDEGLLCVASMPPAGDRWAMASCPVLDEPEDDLSGYQAISVEFRSETPAAEPLYLILIEADGSQYVSPVRDAFESEEWTRYRFWLGDLTFNRGVSPGDDEGLDLDQVDRILIGSSFVTGIERARWSMRDVRLEFFVGPAD